MVYKRLIMIFIILLSGLIYGQKLINELTKKDKQNLMELDKKAKSLFGEKKYSQAYKVFQKIFNINKDGLYIDTVFWSKPYDYLFSYASDFSRVPEYKHEMEEIFKYLLTKSSRLNKIEYFYLYYHKNNNEQIKYIENKYKSRIPSHLLGLYVNIKNKQINTVINNRWEYLQKDKPSEVKKYKKKYYLSLQKVDIKNILKKITECIWSKTEIILKKHRSLVEFGFLIKRAGYKKSSDKYILKLKKFADTKSKSSKYHKKSYQQMLSFIEEQNDTAIIFIQQEKDDYKQFKEKKKLNPEQKHMIEELLRKKLND